MMLKAAGCLCDESPHRLIVTRGGCQMFATISIIEIGYGSSMTVLPNTFRQGYSHYEAKALHDQNILLEESCGVWIIERRRPDRYPTPPAHH